MDRAVLADLERREVEAEGRHLPAELGQVAPRDAAQPIGDERLVQLGQLGLEGGGILVVAGSRPSVVRQGDPRPAQPLGDEPEALTVRLVREAPAQLTVRLGQLLGVAGEPRGQRPGNAVARTSPRTRSA